MDKTSIKSKLLDLIVGDYVYLDEYQDIYYFVKNIMPLFQDIPENILYNCVYRANQILQNPMKKEEYVNVLLQIIFSQNLNNNENA